MNLIDVYQSIITTGGASYNPLTGVLNPSTGYMVSLPGYEKKIDWDDNPNIQFLVKIVNDYLTEEVWDMIADPDNYLGFWISNGKLVIDISENTDDEEYAILEGRKRDQISIWDCSRQKEIQVQL